MPSVINKDTQFCISIAANPGNFGNTLHNAAYEALDLNFIYKSFQVKDLSQALAGVRGLNIRGCSVSMPFKEKVIVHIDELDNTASFVGAVNTIVNDSGRLIGYNTDVVGARRALESIRANPSDRVLLLGAGATSRAIAFALRQIGFSKITVSNRDLIKIQQINNIIDCRAIPWDERESIAADLLINATSLGMSPHVTQSPVNIEFLYQLRAMMDVIVSPMESCIVKLARSMGKEVSAGYEMSFEQTVEQFKLYTGKEAPKQVMKKCLDNLLKFQA